MNSENGVSQIVEFLDLTRDDEIQANCAKILRITLRDEVHFERVTSERTDLGNMLLRNLGYFLFNDVVVLELLAALRNLSRATPQISFIQKQNLNVLIKIAKLPANERIQ